MSKVFFLTGSSRGLGREIAEAVLAAGHRLVATARQPESLADLAGRYGRQILPVALDVADPAAAEAAVTAGVREFGRLDVVVNNAGYADLASVEDVTVDDFRAQVDTNLLGVVYVTKAALPVLRRQGSGRIIQVSSIGGRLATPGLSAYQAAKWAVGGFSEVLAKEVEPLGIKVTVLEPGGMATDWAGSSMHVPPVSEPYQATVGVMARLHHEGDSPPVLGDPGQGGPGRAGRRGHGRAAAAPHPRQRGLRLRHGGGPHPGRIRPEVARPHRLHRPRRRHRRRPRPSRHQGITSRG